MPPCGSSRHSHSPLLNSRSRHEAWSAQAVLPPPADSVDGPVSRHGSGGEGGCGGSGGARLEDVPPSRLGGGGGAPAAFGGSTQTSLVQPTPPGRGTVIVHKLHGETHTKR